MEQADLNEYFQFNIHKSLTSLGIADDDYVRLAAVYGVDVQAVRQMAQDGFNSNAQYAQKLLQNRELSCLQQGKKVTISFLGDSITSDRRGFLNIIRTALAPYQNLQIIDHAISGQKSGDLLTAMYPLVHEAHQAHA